MNRAERKVPMRILFVSTSYPRDASDWRGIFIRFMVMGLARQPGIEVQLWAPPGTPVPSVCDATTAKERAWLSRLMESGGISHLMRHPRPATLLAPLMLLRMLRSAYVRTKTIDLYHLNWLQCAIPLPRNGKPMLVTVLGNDLKLLRIPFVTSLLRRVMSRRRTIICPNADWMQAPLEAAFGDIARIKAVSFGIDPRWYAIDRSAERAGPAKWLAVTRLTADKIGTLFDWSAPLFDGADRELHLFGPMQEEITLPPWVIYHGAATADELSSQWFPEAAGLVSLSRHAEGRPQVMLEAMAAGLPIIASDMAAHASIIDEGITGRLCSTQSDFNAAVVELEDLVVNRRMGEAARARAANDMGTWDDCAARYATLYQELMQDDASQ